MGIQFYYIRWFVLLCLASSLAVSGLGAGRSVRVGDVIIPRGETNCFSIVLEREGNENAVGFGLCFDPNLLTFVSATNVGVASGASLNVNRLSVAQGRLGLALALPTGIAFEPGASDILQVCFRANDGAGIVTTPVTICDQPIRRELVDTNASVLPTTYTNATATLVGTCAYSLATNRVSLAAAEGAGTIVVVASVGCPWSAVVIDDWIAFTSATNGAGNANVGYAVAANPNFTPRTGVVVVAGQTFTVAQMAKVCNSSLDAASRTHGGERSTGMVNVTVSSGCPWVVMNLNSWISFPAGTNGSGNEIVTYVVASNPDFLARTGTVAIAGRTFTVIQAEKVCAYTVATTRQDHGRDGVTNTVAVTVGSGCAWTVVNTNVWIINVSGTSGSGTSGYTYALPPNVGANARTGQVTIAGQTFTVTQQGSPCAFAIEPTLRIHTSASEFAIVNVTAPAGCDWQIINPNDWMIIKLYTGGVGNGIARYTVFANPNPTTRTGTLTIAGQTFTVVQLGAPCGYSILPTERLFGPASGTGVLAVASVTGCGWNVSNTNSWIWITSPANGLGNGGGTVSYDVTASLVPNDRTGVVNVAGQSFTVTQLGSTCSASLSASSRNLTTSAAASGTVGVSISGGCSSTKWRVYNPNSWITITANSQGKGNATVAYSVAANTGAARTGVLTIADKTFTITQAGVPCTYSLSAPSRNHTYLSEPGAFNVTVFSGCAWNVVNTSSWVTVTSGASGVGNGAVAYQLAANPGPARIARLVLGGQVFTINQGQIEPVVFTSLPASRGVLPGATATFTAAVTGTAPVSFQWLFNGTAFVNGPGVSGATTPSLSLANVQLAQAGSYTLVAANLRGPVTSSPPAVLTINTPPMLAALGSRITMRGSLLAFTASATDAQVPGQTLTYSLEPGAPAGSSINATNGLFTWTPGAAQGPSTNSVSVRVTDSGSPPLSDVETMTIFVVTNGSVTNLPLVPIGAVWKYRDTGENLGTAWVAPAFPDNAWASGPAILGYGDGGEGTVVSFGSSSSAKSITTYFRRAFTVTDPASLNALNLRVLRNDGVIVYLNGAEIYRDNMPAGPVSSSTPALANSTNPERSTYQITPPLDPSRLLAGTNVLAAELHIYSGGAGNMGFDLELTGTKNNLPPLILNQPQSRSMPIGGQVSFTVMVAGNLPMNYQWHFQGARLPDATNSSLFLANLQPASAGAYFVVVTNSIGAVTSTVASLTLTQAPNAAPILSAASAKTISDGNVLTWTPATGYAPSTNPATLRVTDSGSTPLSDTKTFNVVVLSPPLLLNASLALDGRVSLLWNAVPGQKYRVQCTTHLASGIWTNLGSAVMAVSDTASATDRELDAPQRFYRIVVADE